MSQEHILLSAVRKAVREHRGKHKPGHPAEAPEVVQAADAAREAGISETEIARAVSSAEYDFMC